MKRYLILVAAALAILTAAVALFAQQGFDPGSQLREVSFEEEPQVLSKLVSWLPQARFEARIDAAVEKYTADVETSDALEIRYRFQELVRETSSEYLLDLLVGFVRDREALLIAASSGDRTSGRGHSRLDDRGGSSGLGVALSGVSDGGNIGTGACQHGQEKNNFGICVDPCPPGHTRSSNGLTCDESGPPVPCPEAGMVFHQGYNLCHFPCSPGWEIQSDGSCLPPILHAPFCPSGQVFNSLTGQCEGQGPDLGSGGTPSLCPVLQELLRSCNETYAKNCKGAEPKFSSAECRELSAQCELYAEDMEREGCD